MIFSSTYKGILCNYISLTYVILFAHSDLSNYMGSHSIIRCLFEFGYWSIQDINKRDQSDCKNSFEKAEDLCCTNCCSVTVCKM